MWQELTLKSYNCGVLIHCGCNTANQTEIHLNVGERITTVLYYLTYRNLINYLSISKKQNYEKLSKQRLVYVTSTINL
jgi:hypothetical protein